MTMSRNLAGRQQMFTSETSLTIQVLYKRKKHVTFFKHKVTTDAHHSSSVFDEINKILISDVGHVVTTRINK